MSSAAGMPGAGSALKPLVKYLQQARIVEKVDPTQTTRTRGTHGHDDADDGMRWWRGMAERGDGPMTDPADV